MRRGERKTGRQEDGRRRRRRRRRIKRWRWGRSARQGHHHQPQGIFSVPRGGVVVNLSCLTRPPPPPSPTPLPPPLLLPQPRLPDAAVLMWFVVVFVVVVAAVEVSQAWVDLRVCGLEVGTKCWHFS